MKKTLLPIFSVLCLAGTAQNFTPNNLVVSRVGNGSTTLSTGTSAVSLLELDTTTVNQATYIKTVALNSVGTSKLTIAGTAVYEGQLSLSRNGQFLSLVGYDAPAGELATNTCISAIAVAAGGAGYTSAPPLTISAPDLPGGIQATGGTQLTGAVVTNIFLNNSGSGYSVSPTITIGGTGTGATAGAVTRIAYWQGFTNKKVIARIDNTGTVDYSTTFPNSGVNAGASVKSAVSVDGSRFWLANNRIETVTMGQTTASTQAASANARSAGIFKDQVYYTLGFSAASLNYTTPALPTTSATTASVGVATSSASQSPVGFVFFDLDPTLSWNSTGYDVVYFCDVNSGLEKYIFDGTTWVPVNSRYMPLATPLNNSYYPGFGLSSLTGTLTSSGKPVLYAVTGNGAGVDNKLLAIYDLGSRTAAMVDGTTASFKVLASAGANYGFRGVAFTPGTNVNLALPISLAAFDGTLVNNKASLTWATASEINAASFVVERSRNGNDFEAIGVVAARNTANHNYSFVDNNLLEGSNYYRLKLTDKNGDFKYSKTIVLQLGGKAAGISVFPNPVTSVLSVAYPAAVKNSVADVLTVDGKKLASYVLAIGSTQRTIDVSALEPGNYRLVVRNNGLVTSVSFVK